jgi:hypothetical protein
VLHVLEQLRNAPNDHKDGPLANLRACPCSTPEVCEARDACIDAFGHHVLGVQLGQKIRAALDGPSDGAANPQRLQQQLLEMNVEIEEGQERMPLCDQRALQLRLRHKL